MKDIFKNGSIQPFLTPEMIIDRGDINLGIFGDPADGGILKTFFAKDNTGRSEDSFLGWSCLIRR